MSSVALKTTASKADKFSVVLGTMTFGWSKASGVCDDAVSKEMMGSICNIEPRTY